MYVYIHFYINLHTLLYISQLHVYRILFTLPLACRWVVFFSHGHVGWFIPWFTSGTRWKTVVHGDFPMTWSRIKASFSLSMGESSGFSNWTLHPWILWYVTGHGGFSSKSFKSSREIGWNENAGDFWWWMSVTPYHPCMVYVYIYLHLDNLYGKCR